MKTVIVTRSSRGVALLAALLVLFVMSILAIGMLSNVEESIEMSKNEENSERALKIAEAGIQVARSSFFDPAFINITTTEPISSVDGFIHGGYFMAYLTSGIVGAEKWTQWRYDSTMSGNNIESEVTTPLRKVWATGVRGVNGSVTAAKYEAKNLYGLVATGAYFPIEIESTATTTTKVRAHHEYTGSTRLSFWTDDKVVTKTATTTPSAVPAVGYATNLSPMASLTRYLAGTTTKDPDFQRLYFTYSGRPSALAAGTADTDSTVRLRAANAKDNKTANDAALSTIWEFDTGRHGVGTAPTLFDPTPDNIGNGDEILYFVVTEHPNLNLKALPAVWRGYPNQLTQGPTQIYIYAVIDTGATYRLKWATPYPDPDVANATSYPTEHAVGTTSPSLVTGIHPPYMNRPADALHGLPENDLLPDYRDSTFGDNQRNLVRGHLAFGENPPAVSAPVVSALYKSSLDATRLTASYEQATAPSKRDPEINIYIMYSALARGAYARGGNGIPWYGDGVLNENGVAGWGAAGIRKPDATQMRVLALRDRLQAANIAAGPPITWNWDWNAAKSRFPTYKWNYRMPGHDPHMTDERPWNAYGEYSWDTWVPSSMAPMFKVAATDQDGANWTAASGTRNDYPVIYAYYKSNGFPTGSANDNTPGVGRSGPDRTNNGSPVNFSGTTEAPTGLTGTFSVTNPVSTWSKAQIMVMAVRDTWDDYVAGSPTHTDYANLNANERYWSNAAPSNPVEPYWTFSPTWRNGTNDYNDADPSDPSLVPRSAPNFVRTAPQYFDMAGTGNSRFGFVRPYWWSEAHWDANVRQELDVAQSYSLFRQGWNGVITTAVTNVATQLDATLDVDVEGETAAMCQDCLNGQGLLVLPLNHDLNTPGTNTPDREDLRIHAINATTGRHQWDYHMAASLEGDNANNSPAIANNRVFVAYMMFNAESLRLNRIAKLDVLDIETGQLLQTEKVDEDADGVILSPTIANGVVYVGTYDYAGPNARTQDRGSTTPPLTCPNWTCANTSDDYIRLFALSPVLRLVSTGIYPMAYQDRSTLLNYSTIIKDTQADYALGVKTSRRKLQVWISGQESKWEEVKDDLN